MKPVDRRLVAFVVSELVPLGVIALVVLGFLLGCDGPKVPPGARHVYGWNEKTGHVEWHWTLPEDGR